MRIALALVHIGDAMQTAAYRGRAYHPLFVLFFVIISVAFITFLALVLIA